jgi:aliphatic nitrilase
MLRRERSALSGIFGPDGRPVSEPLVDKEGIVYGEIDLARCIAPKQMHDIIGHYNRFDIFSLNVNTAPQQPVTFNGAGAPPEPERVLIGPWGEDEIPAR